MGLKTQVRDIIIYVIENSIVEACSLSVNGERLFLKGETSNRSLQKHFGSRAQQYRLDTWDSIQLDK
jgi:hypothetical protein